MKKTLFFSILILSLTGNSQTVVFDWAKQMGGSGADGGTSIAVDASGNVYTTGWFEGITDFDPGTGVHNLTSNGSGDIFIQKLDANGNFQWAKQMGSLLPDRGRAITVNANGNVYTTGEFYETVDFDPGADVNYLSSNGDADIFIQKLDANGNFLWAKSIGASGEDAGTSITADATGNIYTLGHFQDTVDFDPGAGVSNLYGGGLFIQKLDSNGNFLWVKQIERAGGVSIALDNSGNIYSTGGFGGTVDFDPGVGISNLTSSGASDIFIQKLDANGNFIWAKQMGGSGVDYGNSITVDAYSSVYATGEFAGTVDFDPGTGISNLTSNGASDIFIQKLDANGNFIWVKQMGGSGYYDEGHSIVLDTSGNVYTTGGFSSTADFDPGAGMSNLTSNGASDIFIQKLRVSGIGIIENDFGTEFLLYPNPTNGFFTIDLGKPYDATITISDLTGRIILTKTGTDSQLINLKLEEPAGVYLLIVESAEKKAVIKLVKE